MNFKQFSHPKYNLQQLCVCVSFDLGRYILYMLLLYILLLCGTYLQ